jgi:hypothetical protein
MEIVNRQVLTAQSGTGDWATSWIPVGAAGFRNASLTAKWAAAGSTSGTLSIEGTDDPLGVVAVALTIDKSHGTYPTVGATASQGLVALSNCPGFIRMKYTRAAGGAASQFDVYATLSE